MIHQHEEVEASVRHDGILITARHQHQRHYGIHLSTVLAAAGLNGDVRRCWVEDGVDVLHILVDDAQAPAAPIGAYSDEEWVTHRRVEQDGVVTEVVIVAGDETTRVLHRETEEVG